MYYVIPNLIHVPMFTEYSHFPQTETALNPDYPDIVARKGGAPARCFTLSSWLPLVLTRFYFT